MANIFEQLGIIGDPYFDPEGDDYDYATAISSGMTPDETGHWPSRDPYSGQILKGQAHESYPLTEQGEAEAGMDIYQGESGRYYSQPEGAPEAPESGGNIFEQLGILSSPTPEDAERVIMQGYGTPEESELAMAWRGRDPNDETTLLGAGKALGRGFVEGLTIELPAMTGQALQFFSERGQQELELLYRDVYNLENEHGRKAYQKLVAQGQLPNAGKTLADWAERKREQYFGSTDYMTETEKMLYEGSKMLAPSVIPAGTLGLGFRVASGVGATLKLARGAKTATQFTALMREAQIAAKTSAAMANMGTAVIFGGAQAQQTLESATAMAAKLESEGKYAEAEEMRRMARIAPYLTGGIEAAGEYFGTKYLGKLFGVTEAQIVKRGAKRLILDFFKTLGVEVSTEVGQQYGQATVEKYTAIRPEADPLAEALQVIGPTIVMTILTGGAAGLHNMLQKKEAAKPEKEQDKPEGEPKILGPVVPLPEQAVTVGDKYGGLPSAGTMYGMTGETKVVEPGQKPEEAKTQEQKEQEYAAGIVEQMYGDLNDDDLRYVYDKLPKSATAVKAEIKRRMEAGEKPRGMAYVKPEEEVPGAKQQVEIALPEGQGGHLEKAVASVKKILPNFEQDQWQEAPTTEEKAIIHKVSEELGSKVTFFLSKAKHLDRINGFYAHAADRIYINGRSKSPLMFILGHETFHEMEAKHKDLWDKAVEVIKANVTDFDSYWAAINKDRLAAGTKALSEPEAFREFASDLAGQAFTKEKFWRDLNQEHPDVFKALSDVVKKFIKLIKDTMADPHKRHALPKDIIKDLDAVDAAITKAYGEVLKRKGAKVAEGRATLSQETFTRMPREGKVKITAIHAETGQKIKVEEDAKTAIDELDGRIEKYYRVKECLNASA